MIYNDTDGKIKNITAEEIILNLNPRFIAEIHVQNNPQKEERVNANPLFSQHGMGRGIKEK